MSVPVDPQPSSSRLSRLCQGISDKWPGRQRQIKQLVGYIDCDGSGCPNLLVYGPPAAGKTSIVRFVLQDLKRPYIYTSCAEFSKPRQLLQSVLTQLKGKKRRRVDGFAGDAKNDQVAEFLAELPGIARSTSIRHVVIDHAHRIADEDILAAILRVRELTGAELSVILLSRVAWGSGGFEFDTLRAPRPIQISFPTYDEPCLRKILALENQAEVTEHGVSTLNTFLTSCMMPTFGRSTNRLEDLQALVGILYPLYLRPVKEGAAQAGDSKLLHARFLPFLQAAKAAFNLGARWKGALANLATQSNLRLGRPPVAELDFELPYYSKFLLLAAYICSRNKPSLDRRVFDPASRAGKHGHLSHDRQVENAREAALRGPHSFPVERMLAVFWHLLTSEEDDGGNASQQAGDVFTQITSLVSLRLLSRVSSTELDEVKYKCNIPESLATVIAKNLSVKLQDYLLYA